MRKVIPFCGLAAAMVLVAQTSAQPDPEVFKLIRPVTQILQQVNTSALAAVPAVQKELKIDEETAAKINEKVRSAAGAGFGFGGGFGKGKGKEQGPEAKERMMKMFEKVGQLKDTPEDKLEEKVREVFKEEIEQLQKVNQEVEKLLNDKQKERLKQISRQNQRVGYLTSPGGAKELGIKDDQAKKLKEIQSDLQKDTQALFAGGNFGPEFREKMQSLNKEAMEKAMDVLTSEQKDKYKQLTGEPFDLPGGGGRPRPKKDD